MELLFRALIFVFLYFRTEIGLLGIGHDEQRYDIRFYGSTLHTYVY